MTQIVSIVTQRKRRWWVSGLAIIGLVALLNAICEWVLMW